MYLERQGRFDTYDGVSRYPMDKRKKSKIEKYINELPDNYRVRLGP